MIRLLQVRVNTETVDVDHSRPAAEGDEAAAAAAIAEQELAADVRRAIQTVEREQDEVREATEKLANERGDEVPP